MLRGDGVPRSAVVNARAAMGDRFRPSRSIFVAGPRSINPRHTRGEPVEPRPERITGTASTISMIRDGRDAFCRVRRVRPGPEGRREERGADVSDASLPGVRPRGGAGGGGDLRAPDPGREQHDVRGPALARPGADRDEEPGGEARPGRGAGEGVLGQRVPGPDGVRGALQLRRVRGVQLEPAAGAAGHGDARAAARDVAVARVPGAGEGGADLREQPGGADEGGGGPGGGPVRAPGGAGGGAGDGAAVRAAVPGLPLRGGHGGSLPTGTRSCPWSRTAGRGSRATTCFPCSSGR